MESVIVVRSETWTFPSHVTRTGVRYTLLRRGEERPLNPIFLISADGIRSTEAGGLAGNTCLDILTKELPVVELEAARDLAGLCSLLMICDTPQSASLLSDVTVLASHWSMSSSLASHWWTVDIFPCSWC